MLVQDATLTRRGGSRRTQDGDELGGDGEGHGGGELGQIPKIFEAEQLDADVAAAFGIEARIDYARFHAAALVATAEHNGSVDFNRMATDEAGAMKADGRSPGFLFPSVARIFAAQPYRDARPQTRAAAQIFPQRSGAAKNFF